MALSEFLNRTEGMRRVAAFISNSASGRRVLLVTGPAGCGKSELLRRAVAREHGWPLVSVDRATSPDGLPCATSLAEALAARIDEQAVPDGFPDRRTAMGEFRRRLGTVMEAALGVAAKASKIVAIGKEVKDRLAGAHPAFSQADPASLYVLNALRDTRCAVHVDHADGCVSADWSLLASLLATTKCVLLLEGSEAFRVTEGLSDAPVDHLAVPPLDMDYATVLFDSLPASLGKTLRTDFRRSGSLKPYGSLAASRRTNDRDPARVESLSDSMLRYAREAFDSLSAGDRRVLIALSAHAGGAVGIGLLRRFLSGVQASAALTTDLLAVLGRLEDKVLLVRTSEGVQAPEIVLDIVGQDGSAGVVRLTFQGEWRDFYRDPARCGMGLSDQRRCLQALRQCVMLKDTVGIAATLEAVGTLHDEAGSRADSAGFTIWLASQFDLRAEPGVAAAAARHLYAAGWFEQARDVLATVGEPGSRRDRYLMAELYCAAGPHDRGLRLALHHKRSLGDRVDPDAELCLELVIIHALRNSDRFDEARRRYKSAVIQQRFHDRDAFTVLLRFADLCLMRDDDLVACCDLLERAAATAVERNQIHEAVSAYVALSQQHGYHDLDAAAHHLANAAKAAEGRWVQIPAILNNTAVLDLYRGNVLVDGLRLLEDALILSSDPLEEILIRTNIVVHRMLSGSTRADGLAELSARVVSEALDTEIRRIAHFNLEQAYRACGDEAAAIRHGATWRVLRSGIDEAFWKARGLGIRTAAVPAWRLDLPYYPVYLSHWKLGTIPFDAVADDL